MSTDKHTVPPSTDLCACGHGRAMHHEEDGDHNGPCLWQVHSDAPFCKCDMWTSPTARDDSERGWLIERKDKPQPVWWMGHSSRGMEWTPNSLEAIRFARKIDADMVNVSLLGSCGEATEHAWIPARAEHERSAEK